jgi:chromosomal replication initiator protein
MSLARRALRETLGRAGPYRITIDDIICGVSRTTKISEKKLIGRGRKMEVALARQMAMYLCRELVGASLENVGLHFGGRDHTTVIHACRTIKTRMEKDQEFKEGIKSLRAQVGG